MMELIDLVLLIVINCFVSVFLAIGIYLISYRSVFQMRSALLEFRGQMQKDITEFKLSLTGEVDQYRNKADSMEARIGKTFKRFETMLDDYFEKAQELMSTLPNTSNMGDWGQIIGLVKEIAKNSQKNPSSTIDESMSPIKQQYMTALKNQLANMTDEQLEAELKKQQSKEE